MRKRGARLTYLVRVVIPSSVILLAPHTFKANKLVCKSHFTIISNTKSDNFGQKDKSKILRLGRQGSIKPSEEFVIFGTERKEIE